MSADSLEPGAIPVSTLLQFLDREERRLHIRAHDLAAMRGEVAQGARQPAAEEGSPASFGIDLFSATDIGILARGVQAPARLWVSAGSAPEAEGADGLLRDLSIGFVPARSRRALYPLEIIDSGNIESGACLRRLRERAGQGEEQRLLPVVPARFAILDDILIIPVDDVYAVVHHRSVLFLAQQLFELSWGQGLELPQALDPDAVDATIVGLLARGMKDEAVARYLGLSLRTVRRRVAAIMARHRVTTRFELGVQLAVQDLLPRGEARPDRSSR